MPILTVKVSAKESDDLTQKISELLISLTRDILHKKPEVTAIIIDYVNPKNWIIAGTSLTQHQQSSFYFDIKITDETNTKSEKEQYIKEAFAGFGDILGEIHEESYIYVQDVRAASYGYGGLTQEFRYHHPHQG